MYSKLSKRRMLTLTGAGIGGCVMVLAVSLGMFALLALGATKLVQWGFHTPFAPTYVISFFAVYILAALSGKRSN